MLQEDDRRRFTLGFTIEGRIMRLWYVSRADIFISQDFDFMAVSRLHPLQISPLNLSIPSRRNTSFNFSLPPHIPTSINWDGTLR